MSETAELVARIGKLNEELKSAKAATSRARRSGNVSAYLNAAKTESALRHWRVKLRAEKMEIDARP